jgi:hypothetical protein
LGGVNFAGIIQRRHTARNTKISQCQGIEDIKQMPQRRLFCRWGRGLHIDDRNKIVADWVCLCWQIRNTCSGHMMLSCGRKPAL